jgi:tape measure domain-containing protein
MADEKIIRIRLDSSGARLDANRTNKAVRSIGESADRAESSMMRLSSVANAVVTALATARVIQYADAWTNVNNRLKAATNTAKEFAIAQDGVIAIAQRAGVDLNSVADAYSRIAQATAELGISQERVLDVTEKVTLALKAGGATTAEAASVMVQFGQALGSGVLQGDELKSILEGSIPITKALAKEFGVTTGELKKLGAEGKITSDRVVAAIESIDKKSLTFTKDVKSGFVEVSNALTVYVGKLDESLGASEEFYGVLRGLSENIDAVVATVGTFIKLGLAVYLTNVTKAVWAQVAAFTAGQAQIIRYNSTLAAASGVSRVAAASTWALTYAMRALKAALPFGVILLGLEVLQNMITATNDQINANDRYAESTRKLNATLETRAEKERAIALRTAAEVNARNQMKLLDQLDAIEKQKLKIEKSRAAEAAKIRGQEYDEADRLTLYQLNKTQNRIKIMEDEAARLQRIADNSQAAFLKIQNSVGGQSTKGEILKGVFSDPSKAAQAPTSAAPTAPTQQESNIVEQLARENSLIQNSLLARKGIYQQYYADANNLQLSQYERAQAQLAMDIELRKQAEATAFVEELQAISDRQLAIAENKALTDTQKTEADALLREQAVLAAQEFENKLTEIAAEGSARRQQLDQQEAVNRIGTYQNYANTALSLANAFGSKSEKAQKKRRKASVLIDTAAGIGRAFAEHNFYEALGISALIAANGAAQISAINSSSSSTPIQSGGASLGSSQSSFAQPQQQQRRIIDLRGFESGGFLTKSQLTELLQNDDDVILANNSGQSNAQRTGLING